MLYFYINRAWWYSLNCLIVTSFVACLPRNSPPAGLIWGEGINSPSVLESFSAMSSASSTNRWIVQPGVRISSGSTFIFLSSYSKCFRVCEQNDELVYAPHNKMFCDIRSKSTLWYRCLSQPPIKLHLSELIYLFVTMFAVYLMLIIQSPCYQHTVRVRKLFLVAVLHNWDNKNWVFRVKKSYYNCDSAVGSDDV